MTMWLPTLKPSLEILWAADRRLEEFQQRQHNYQWASLVFCLRQDRWQREVLSHELLLYKELILELRSVPPLGLTLDLMALLRQGEQFSPRRLQEEDRPFSRTLLRIQNDLLYRLARFASFQRTRHLLMRLSNEAPEAPTQGGLVVPLSLQDRALVYLVGQLFSLVRPYLVEGYRPHPLPKFSGDQSPDWWQAPTLALSRFEESIEREGWMVEQLNTILDHFIRLSETELVQGAWAPILSHFDLLHNKLERVRWQQMAWSSEQIEAPEDLRTLFTLRDEGYHQIRLPSRSIIPEGGIQGLCRRGELSSLLPSELSYWEPQQNPKDVDLFALRFVERELLYYEREQSVSYTWQRRLQILLHLDPGEIRYKRPDMSVSGSALLFGFLSRLTMDLWDVCPEEVLRLEYYLAPQEAWWEEAATYRLFLGSAAKVGGSTSLHLLPHGLSNFLSKHPPVAGDFRLLLVTPSTWSDVQYTQRGGRAHLSLCFAPAEQSLITHGLPLPQTQANEGPGRTTQSPARPGDTTAPQSRSGSLSLRNQAPDHIFCFGKDEENFQALAHLRDAMLQSILRAPPHIEGDLALHAKD